MGLYICQINKVEIVVSKFPASETHMRMGTSSGCSDFCNRLGGQALVMIGRRYSRQPCSVFRIIESEEKLGAGKMCVAIQLTVSAFFS